VEYAKEDTSMKQLATRFMLISYLAYSSAFEIEATCSSETPVDFISQNVDLFIIAASSESNPTTLLFVVLVPIC
jgi:hypothetical protein